MLEGRQVSTHRFSLTDFYTNERIHCRNLAMGSKVTLILLLLIVLLGVQVPAFAQTTLNFGQQFVGTTSPPNS